MDFVKNFNRDGESGLKLILLEHGFNQRTVKAIAIFSLAKKNSRCRVGGKVTD